MQDRLGLPFRVYKPAAIEPLRLLCATHKVRIEVTHWKSDVYPMLVDKIKEMDPAVNVKSHKFLFQSKDMEALNKLEHKIRKGFRRYSFRLETEYQSNRGKHAVLLVAKFDPDMDSQEPGSADATGSATLNLGGTKLIAEHVDRTAVMPSALHLRASSHLDDNEVSILWDHSVKLTSTTKAHLRRFAYQLLNIVGDGTPDF